MRSTAHAALAVALLAAEGPLAMAAPGAPATASSTAATPPAPTAQPPAATPLAPATATAPSVAAPPSKPAPARPPLTPAAIDKLLDAALEHYYAKRHALAAAPLYALVRDLPETELRRDTVEFYLAASLAALGYTDAAVEHYVEIVAGRRSPELVARALSALDAQARRGLLDETRLIDEVLFGHQFGDLPADAADFVEYYQGLGELRRRFTAMGAARLERFATSGRRDGFYTWRGRYALAVERLAEGNEEGAEKLLRAILEAPEAPRPVLNDARTALARMLYGRGKWEDAFDLYSRVDAPLASQDLILVEQAWTKVAAGDERRALGMIVGLGAPIYKLVFAPERWLIRALALNRLCQFRPAHLTVLDFRRRHRAQLDRIRERRPLLDDPVLVEAAQREVELAPATKERDRLRAQRAQLATVLDKPLHDHLEAIYTSRFARAEAEVARSIGPVLEKVADRLLTVDEQMTILDYEVGVGLFKGLSEEDRRRAEAPRSGKIPFDSDRVYYPFGGEYWSDEIHDFEVRADDRCPR